METLTPPAADPHTPLSAYVHVPFCRVRCGYCDFNTYVNDFGEGASRDTYASSVISEILASRDHLSSEFQTVFFGGGTPSLLQVADLALILDHLAIGEGAEVTIEANPETLTADSVLGLKDAGFTRVSVGMQSAVPQVLTTLDRQHRPERLPVIARWVRDAGLDFSVDLIYGTPGESISDWERSLEAALALEPDHISAYSLIIEEGTKMHSQVRRGELPTPDPDDAADKYLLADRILGSEGFRWYEISNFAREEPGEERVEATQLRHASAHNLAYWRDWNWWGYGPGAHSHIGDTRWWNVKHPLAYAAKVRSEALPIAESETLTADQRDFERLMLGIRTAEGIPWDRGVPHELDGLVTTGNSRLVLTLRGRLMADYVTRVLAGWE